jgi:hypothetical protein
MRHTKTSMDAASYALWKELRAPCIKRIRPKAIYGTACCLLWLMAGLLFGKTGLLWLVLVWFLLYLPVGIAHMFFGECKDSWWDRFAPAFYMMSPVIGFFILLGQVVGMIRGKPFIPTIFTGKDLASISRDVDDGHGYRFTMTSGKSVAITRDKYDSRRMHIPYHHGTCSGCVGDLTGLLTELDEALIGAPMFAA